MIKKIIFKKFQKIFMRDTDPVTGTLIAVCFQDVQPNMEKLQQFIGKFPQKDATFFIVFENHPFTDMVYVIVFDTFQEFKNAIAMHRSLMHQTTPDYVIPIWIGGYDLNMLVKASETNYQLLKTIPTHKTANYSGRVISK